MKRFANCSTPLIPLRDKIKARLPPQFSSFYLHSCFGISAPSAILFCFFSVFGCFYFSCLCSCNIFWPAFARIFQRNSRLPLSHTALGPAPGCVRVCANFAFTLGKDFCNGGKYSSVEGNAVPRRANESKKFYLHSFLFLKLLL